LSTGQIVWHASLQTGESRVLRAEVTSYFRVNTKAIFFKCCQFNEENLECQEQNVMEATISGSELDLD
jgi:hypothetical protein